MSAIKGEQGQILVVLAVGLLILILFMGLAVDVGMAYITKANLSKAVDAACLTGMKALPQGQPTATTLATHIFNANYGPNPPVPIVTFPVDPQNGDQQIKVTATANVPTFFAQHFFQFWHVSDTAIATRGKLVMSLVLDRSGSMATTGSTQGGPSLQVAVGKTTTDNGFINDWDDTKDEVAMISYGSSATVDVAINYNFRAPITTKVKNLTFAGGTFGTGGTYVANIGPPLTLADNQIGSVPILPGQNVTRVAIYFTDGLMNEIQDTLSCNGTLTPYNFGGYDDGSGGGNTVHSVGFFNPANGTQIYMYDGSSTWYTCNSSGQCTTKTTTSCLRNVAGFMSVQSGTIKPFNRANVTAEAQYRAKQTANAMRAETPGTYIYVIGLGQQIHTSMSTKAFLATLANDPNPTDYDGTQITGGVYSPSLPAGLVKIVPDCPSTACTTELQKAFQDIASKILLRLTQ